ncbi:MAG TPA: hypothetical protein DCR48_02635 [Flavobacteriales bacterium]|nr:hypothetical protein [Flavobacteriales bacterium]
MSNFQNFKQPITMILYPNNVGLAYVICQGMKDVIDEGIQKIAPYSDKKVMRHIRYYLDYAQPDIVILRDHHNEHAQFSVKRKKIMKKIEETARAKNLQVHQYTRKQIKQVFEQFGGKSKFAIARQIASWYPHLKLKLPRYRRLQDSEHYQMGVFDSYALMITHYYLND